MEHPDRYPFWHFVPAAHRQPDRPWPLILFLHGAGERGTDLRGAIRHGPPTIARKQPDFPFVVVAPQCPPGERWQTRALLHLLDEALQRFPVDTSRIYLTGLSMGGAGAWQLAAAAPQRFAALVPICGYGDPASVTRLGRLPTWVFHGARDTVVRLEESERMVQALEEAGGNVQFTVYPDADHAEAWKRAYRDQQLYDWLLQQPIGT